MNELKVGSEVYIYTHQVSRSSLKPARIERETRTFWVSEGKKYRKSDLSLAGQKNAWTTIKLTPRDAYHNKMYMEQETARQKAYRISVIEQNLRGATDAQIEEIYSILKFSKEQGEK